MDRWASAEVLGEDDLVEDYDISDESGVVTKGGAHPSESLGAAAVVVARRLGLDGAADDASACVAIGASPLRAAAWLRARGAAVGHAASRSRLLGAEGAAYEAASRTPISRSGKTQVRFAISRSQQIGAWFAATGGVGRAAILLARGGAQPRSLVVVGASAASLWLYDPVDRGVREVPHAGVDAMRADPLAAWEVLLAAVR